MTSLDQPCPHCDAKPGERCVDSHGRKSLFVHRDRHPSRGNK
jgi:hypothetical protein